MKTKIQSRFLCYIFDFAVSFGISFLLVKLFGFKLPFEDFLAYFVNNITFYTIVIYFVYITICYAFINGQSLGGLIFNVKVVGVNNRKTVFGASILRAALQALFPIALFNIPYMLVYRTQISVFDSATNTKTVKIRRDNK